MKNFKVGLQLYSLREELAKDLDGTLKVVSDMGYEYVEYAGFFGLEAKELKAKAEKYGLKGIAAHHSYEFLLEDAQKWVTYFKEAGIKYVAIPWLGKEHLKGGEGYEELMKKFAEIGKLLKENGIQLMYHNHNFEFARKDGKFLLEWLLDDVGDVIVPELDVCWVHFGGYNPEKYMLKYENRIPVLHLKDFVCTKLPEGPVYSDEYTDELKYPDTEAVGFQFAPIGYGVQDIPAILSSAEKIGTEYIIVEQDSFTDISPIEAVKKSREYLKSLGI